MSARDVDDRTGGPAFPIMDLSQNTATGETITYQYTQSGVSLRDYFAAKELARIEHASCGVNDVQGAYDRIATHCYRMADAMLAARERT